jgi:Lon protease-like protein
MIKLVPLFPLQLVLYPNEILPLHIFEERYKNMIQYCIETDEPFGLLSYIDQKVSRIGCLCKINKVNKKYEDGRIDIVCQGSDRFLVHSFNSSKSYLQGTISAFHDAETMEDAIPGLLERLQGKYDKLLEIAAKSWEDLPDQLPANSYEFAHLVGFDLAQKQNLLEIKSETERLKFLIEHLDRIIPQMKAFEEVQNRIKLNGHFREFPPLNFNI